MTEPIIVDTTEMLAAAQGNEGMLPHHLSDPLLHPEHSNSADCPKIGVRMALPYEVGSKAAPQPVQSFLKCMNSE